MAYVKSNPNAIRYRQFLLSLDVDWPRMETNSKFLKTLMKGLTFIKLPFPAIEYNTKDELKGYYIYF